jgi:hypothetical protein
MQCELLLLLLLLKKFLGPMLQFLKIGNRDLNAEKVS